MKKKLYKRVNQKVLQYFGNAEHDLTVPTAFGDVIKVTNDTR